MRGIERGKHFRRHCGRVGGQRVERGAHEFFERALPQYSFQGIYGEDAVQIFRLVSLLEYGIDESRFAGQSFAEKAVALPFFQRRVVIRLIEESDFETAALFVGVVDEAHRETLRAAL